MRLLLAVIAFWTLAASAQPFPSKPIRLVVPYTPGTGYDSIARIVGPSLAQRLGQPVVVENMPGASGTLGAGTVARAAADGHTLATIGEGTMASGHLYKALPFNPLSDFAPITLAGYGTLLMVASQASGLKSAGELVEKAKAQPGKLTFSSPGVSTSQYLKMMLFLNTAGIDMLHVPYKGSAGAINDLIGGQVHAGLVPVHAAMQHVQAGRLVPLAALTSARHPVAPQVATLKELGLPAPDAKLWYAFVAPKATPSQIVTRLNTEMRAIMDEPEVKGRLERVGLEVHTTTPAELQAIMQRESDVSREIVRRNNIALD
jgi:tripartite-type tricarboxylate transporter receptor subunit TctC